MANEEPRSMTFLRVLQFVADSDSQEYHLPGAALSEARTDITQVSFDLLTDCEVNVYWQEERPLVRLYTVWSQGRAGFINSGQSIGSVRGEPHGFYHLPGADYAQTIEALEGAKFVQGLLPN